MKKKIWLIIGILLLIVVTVAVSIFFYRRSNSLRLLLEECKLDASENTVQIIDERSVNGQEYIVLMTEALPGSQLGEPHFYGVFLLCQKNELGFWTLVDHNSVNMLTHSQFLWSYPLENGQREFHAVYCGSSSTLPGDLTQCSDLLPEGVSVDTAQHNHTYKIHLSYVANQPMKIDFMDLMEENGLISHNHYPSSMNYTPKTTFSDSSDSSRIPYESILFCAIATVFLFLLILISKFINPTAAFFAKTSGRIFDDPFYASLVRKIGRKK